MKMSDDKQPGDSRLRNRRTLRMRGYDYARAGAYFVTVFTCGRQYLFGEIVGEKVVLSEQGKLVEHCFECVAYIPVRHVFVGGRGRPPTTIQPNGMRMNII
ncbi:MAG: hypothetical protein GX409_12885 [candidate division Zixibacteria bacterium]|nr:hypothetical protein [candidate division Zixibacteria bacterium]